MKLAISNIAWPAEAEPAAAAILADFGIDGVEVAPTKVWAKPLEATDAEIDAYRAFWASRGIQIVATQSLLFGRPDLAIFGSPEKRDETLAYLRGVIRLSARLGARVLVFGSPRNRRVNGLAPAVAARIASDFFGAAGEVAAAHGMVLCIEPNPPQYECDFVTTSAQGLELVRNTNSTGFGLHLDSAAITLAGESPDVALEACAGDILHFHASEPHLLPLGLGGVDHHRMAALLRGIDYSNWVSVEMRLPQESHLETELSRVAAHAIAAYRSS